VICEILNSDGSMARIPQLVKFCKKHGLKLGKISDIADYLKQVKPQVICKAQARLPTRFGNFTMKVYESAPDGQKHIALIKNPKNNSLTRIHSECFTGDVLHSLRCDCGQQLSSALKMIGKSGGALLYMAQEGRGIGLVNKLKAYNLQDRGFDTVTANHALGFKTDLRAYGAAAQILLDLGIKSVRLITNNPRKVQGLSECGIKVIGRVPLVIAPNAQNRRYLAVKKNKLKHYL
ncbi:MAG: GTP cyclohydrolase II, partial [Elusimicrobia bacterium]|nr:GTP cyclohydrolase II [Elusimicrobiota bacterium]